MLGRKTLSILLAAITSSAVAVYADSFPSPTTLSGMATPTVQTALSGAAPQAAPETSIAAPRKITAQLLIDTSTTLAPGASQSAGEGLSQSGFYRLDLGVPLPAALTVSLRGGYSQEYSYVTDSGSPGGFADTGLTLMKAWGEIRKGLTLSSGLSLTLPTSIDSGKAGLKTAVGLSIPLEEKVGRFTFDLIPKYTEFFNDITVQANGVPVKNRVLSIATQVAYSITEKFGTDVLFWPSRSWTYGGVPSDKYYIAYEVTYDFSKHFGAAAGLLNNENALKSNGLDSNYAVFDQGMTTAYFDLTMTL